MSETTWLSRAVSGELAEAEVHRRHTVNGRSNSALLPRPLNAFNPINTPSIPETPDLHQSRKRRSLNLSIGYGSPADNSENESPGVGLERGLERGPTSPVHSSPLAKMSPISGSNPVPSRRKRHSSRPNSVHIEQERLLQQHLQLLARTENARLNETFPNSPADVSASLLHPPSFASSPVSASTPTPPKRSSRRPLSIVSSPQTNSSPSSMAHYSSSPSSAPPSPFDVPAKQPQRPQRRHQRSKSHRRNSGSSPSNIFIMRPEDFELLRATLRDDEDTHQVQPSSTLVVRSDLGSFGPRRPGDVSGTILSWRMTSDMLQKFGYSMMSFDEMTTLMIFLWSMFSRPENLWASMRSGGKLLPPSEAVNAIRRHLPSIQAIQFLCIRILCAGFSASVLFVQMSLLLLMVMAYVVGDTIVVPSTKLVRMLSKPKKTKKKTDRR